ncbi:unnamed protein product [marine sediment metagenome]|uniref:Uncharacterized protein n=1 Tax=marine sediment metagenome TaxID=412755 RepID=X0VG96_9ZZZZ
MPIATVRITVDFLSDKQNTKLMWIEALQGKPAENASTPATTGKKAALQHSGIGNGNVPVDHKKEFDLIWQKYPRKIDKSIAFDRFKAQVKTEDDLQLIGVAVKKFAAEMEREARPWDKILYGGTWFNKRWRDWAEFVPPKTPEEVRASKPFKMVCPACGQTPCQCMAT